MFLSVLGQSRAYFADPSVLFRGMMYVATFSFLRPLHHSLKTQYHIDIFDLVVPLASLCSLAAVFLGPLYFPRIYVSFLIFYISSFIILSVNHSLKFRKTVKNLKDNISATNDMETNALVKPAYTHVFVIPNYGEPLSLLQNTIEKIASHTFAKECYVLVLAMEETEVGHSMKGTSLESEFRHRFKEFIVTVHPTGVPGESPGKASNVGFAARTAASALVSKGYSMKQMILTVSDADALFPELYIQSLEKTIAETEDPCNTMYAPPIFFSRNHLNVPASVRITDLIWSIMMMQNLSNQRGVIFPCSNYSLGYSLAEKVGYWDTDSRAIGEDVQMYLKCFFKTDGIARAKPIYVPINLTNVQTHGYISNLNARFVQAKRHYSAVPHVSYALRHALNRMKRSSTPFSMFLMVCFHVLEAHVIPATSGWLMMVSLPVLEFMTPTLFANDPTFAMAYILLKILSVLSFLPMACNIVMYEMLHRFIDLNLFKKSPKESRQWYNIFDFLWLPVSAVVFMTLPSTVATVKRLVTEEKYIVAEKLAVQQD